MHRVALAALVAVIIVLVYLERSNVNSPPVIGTIDEEEKTAHTWQLRMRFVGDDHHNVYECTHCHKQFILKCWSPFDDKANMELVYKQNYKEPYC